MIDTVITFADHDYATMFDYDCHTGNLIERYFGLGRGPNDLMRFLYAFPVQGDSVVYVVDASSGVVSYAPHSRHLARKGIIDFHWRNSYSRDYQSPRNYNLMFMSGFDMHFHRLNDSILLIPVNIMTRYTAPEGRISPKHYREGGMFGLLNTNTMSVDNIFGRFPELYVQKSMPHMEYFTFFDKHRHGELRNYWR